MKFSKVMKFGLENPKNAKRNEKNILHRVL